MKTNQRNSISEENQIRRIQNGDKKTFSELYVSNFTQMCDFAVSITHDEEVTKELIQDVFINIWTNREHWRPKSTIRSYLYRAIKNRAFDYLKHKKVEREWHNRNYQSNSENAETPYEQYTRAELEQFIQKAVDELPEKRKMIYLLSRIQGLKYREIADVMKISEKTVENQMGHALKKLRELVNKYLK